MRRTGVIALLFLFFFCATAALAQIATTSLRGTVTDPSGAVVPGATITLTDKATSLKLTTTSKSSGEYELPQIQPATYLITITAPGFGTQSKSAELLVNQPATINFALSVQSNDQVVDVTESAQTLNTTDASLGGSVDNQTIQALPSETRDVADLLSLQPGVLYLGPSLDSRNGAVNGGRSDEGNVTLDGIDDNDQVYGYAFFGVLRETQDSVEEFRVTTGNGNSDEGRSSGAQISLVTKSGTNKFHGAAYEYNRPTNTVSNDFFLKQSQLEAKAGCLSGGGSAATCDPMGNRPPKKIRNIFGAAVSGPIFKKKLFFFANYEGERINESGVVTETTPFASYKAGNITYTGDSNPNSNPPVVDPNPQTLTEAQLATLDALNGCSVCNTSAYPNPPGANPNALAYIDSLPTANSHTAGDLLNTGGYVFSSPLPQTENTTIARIDYDPSPKHRIFARGNLQKDVTAGAEQFPDQPPATKTEDNTKGMTFGDTWTISANIVNDIRYGYIRQAAGTGGSGVGEYVDFDGLTSPTSESRDIVTSVPLNNIVDNLNITKGRHNIQLGVNWRLIHQNSVSTINSFDSASTNYLWFDGGAPQPSKIGLEPYDSSFSTDYLIAYANLVGSVPFVTDIYNYELTSPTAGSLLAEGAPIARHYSANEYEGYIQDSWHATPNLTLTFGLRYVNLQTPWETKGQELTPTIDTDAWYKERESAALQGQIYEPILTFAPAGPYFHKPGFYEKSKDNVAPRFALAYALNSKTSIRAGAGIYYDHYGESLINLYVSGGGGYGLSSENQGTAATYTVATAPRYTARNVLPFSNGTGAPTVTYPITPGPDFSITYGLDNHLKTPYTEAFDLSLQRLLPGGFTLETNYVGRMGRHLLQSIDLAEPVDYTDPQGGGDYYTAGTTLSKITDENNQSSAVTVQPIPYFEDVFPYMKNYDGPGESATQAIYKDFWAPERMTNGATFVLQLLDSGCGYCVTLPAGQQSRFWSNQFSSMYSLATVGMSYYDAAQVTLHHPMRHGLQFDLNYTFSKSIDFGSDTERTTEYASNRHIVNTWKPQLDRGVSDFDTHQLLTLNFVDKLPFGKGQDFFGSDSPLTDAFIGGWQLSGIYRLSSGLPFTLYEPSFQTNYDFPGKAVEVVKFKAHRTFNSANDPQYFSNAAQINAGAATGSPVRLPYPGEAGERNSFRGDGYNDLDMSLSKAWRIGNYGALKFSWEVYNVENIVHFDPESISASLVNSAADLGIAGGELTMPRRMQFALRYDF
jgi:hypothetical protein